jgi:fructokinase
MKVKHCVVGIGELLWDMLPAGKQLGGAPANFIYHAGILGAEAYTVSTVGNDASGREILDLLDNLKVSKKFIGVDNEHITGTVSVSLDKNGVPSYIIHKNVAWDFIPFNDDLITLARKADAICFGSLAQRSQVSANSIISFLKALKKDCLKIYDINLRQNFYTTELITASLKLSDILKLNDEELRIISNLLSINGSEKELLKQILKTYNLRLIALTKGAEGSILISEKEYSEIKAPAIKIVDTVGAGDSFTAALTMGLLKGHSIGIVHNHANSLAGYVCSKAGAMPRIEPDLINSLDNL